MSNRLEADYLVVGAGAMGMAFTDVILTETDRTVIMVDRHHQPGGHWNLAYPYVRLHQPSAFYGVNSRVLGSDTIDATGWNQGLYELATSSEVLAYFDQVMQQSFLPSGRVQYFPMCEYLGEGRFRSRVSGEEYVASSPTTVDATYMHVTVPSMRAPLYQVDEGVASTAPNGLPLLPDRYERFVIVGAGKTGMDACLFLLRNGIDPDRLSWIMPRDSWMLDRANIQPAALFSESIGRSFVRQAEAILAATSVDDLFRRLEGCGQLLRFDPDVRPTMYRCATVTQAELEALRRIRQVVRLGHVQRISKNKIYLDQGDMDTSSATLHVDCTADGLERRPATPVFGGASITLQAVRTCQQVFSAAFIGHVEAAYKGDGVKNELCSPVPHPDSDLDFLRTSLANNRNALNWGKDPDLVRWLLDARLDGFSQPGGGQSTANDAGPSRVDAALAAIANLEKLLAGAA